MTTMMGCKSLTVHKNKLFRPMLLWQALWLSGLLSQSLYAETTTSERQTLQQSVARLFTPQSDQNFTRVRISELSQFQLDTQNIQEMPRAVPASSVSETAASARSSVQQLAYSSQWRFRRSPLLLGRLSHQKQDPISRKIDCGNPDQSTSLRRAVFH